MKKIVFVATAVLIAAAARLASAADLGVSPANIAMTIATGESGSTTVIGSVNSPPPVPYSIAMQLRLVGGSLPPAWLATQPATLTNRTISLLLPLAVRVPANAAPGRYLALIQPVAMSTTIPLTPTTRPLQLSVTVTSKCSLSPTVSVASAAPAEFKSPNDRLEDVGVSGSVTVPAGCTLGSAWYTLADEYGVFDETKSMSVAPDGSFSFTAPVQVSRRGDDKDGRLYRFTVYAADEAGTGSSAPAVVVVRHDQRVTK